MRASTNYSVLVTLRKESKSGNFNGEVIQTALEHIARMVRCNGMEIKFNVTNMLTLIFHVPD